MDKMPAPGFSLLELMITLAVAATLAVLTAPAMAGVWRHANVLQVLHYKTASLALARSLAISRRHPVTLCPSSDGRTCTGGVDWSSGWIVFLDPDRTSQPPSQAHVVEVVAAVSGGLALRSTTGRQRIRYQPHGWASGSNTSLHLCSRDGRNELLASIVINNAGRARSARPARNTPCPGA